MTKISAMILLSAILAGCVGSVVGDAGCTTYGDRRPFMPTLGEDAVSQWVDVTDAAMTAACR